MASKGGKKVILVKKKKSGSKKGTQGGQSFRNYSKKSKNLDYKYRIQDCDDVSSQQSLNNLYNCIERRWGVYENYMKSTGMDVAKLNKIKQQYISFSNANMNTLCWFIPLSTTSFVSKNMTVEVRARFPFAYCIFQNTNQFKRAFEYYSSGEYYSQLPTAVTDIINKYFNDAQKKVTQELFWNTCLNVGGQNDSMIGFSMTVHNNDQMAYFNDSRTVASMSWPQICQSQSSYKEVRNASNSGVYNTTINCYYTRASQYLTNSSNPGAALYGYKTQNTSEILEGNWRTPDIRTCVDMKEAIQDGNSLYDNVFRGGDMMVCIIPMYYLQMVDPAAYKQDWPSYVADPQIGNFPQMRVTRHYYLLNQDVGIRNVSIQEYQLKVISKVLKYMLNVPTANNQGGGGSSQNRIVSNIQRRLSGVQVQPLLREDVEDAQQNENCVVVDEKCYDEANQQLEMTSYMDLNGRPANQGSQILESIEGEDTMNCNAIVSVGNNTDSSTCFDATVTNTGPALIQTHTGGNITLTSSIFGMNTDSISDYEAAQTNQTTIDATDAFTYDTFNPPTVQTILTGIQTMVNMIIGHIPFQVVIPQMIYDTTTSTHKFDFSHADVYGLTGEITQPYIKIFLLCGISVSSDPNRYILRSAPPCIYIKDYQTLGSITVSPLMFEQFVLMFQTVVDQIVYLYSGVVQDVYGTYNLNQLNQVKYGSDLFYSESYDPGNYYGICGYLRNWLIDYNSNSLQAKGEGWKKFKGFLGKVAKFVVGKVIPIGTKVASAIVPAPYGTVVSAVGNAVTNITTQLNLIGAKKNNNTSSVEAVQDDTVTDEFVVTPQYRLSSNSTPADIAAEGTDWIDGEPISVPVTQYGEAIVGGVIHQITQHPSYYQIQQALEPLRLQGIDVGAYCQQRIKVRFLKRNVTRNIARGYKALMMLGSDTTYATDEDVQQIDSDVTESYQNAAPQF